MSKSNKGQPGRKRPAKQPDDFFWDCSVCTYKNNPEAFKCVICDVRKGTSTRKSRINPDLVAVQVQHALLPPPLPPKLLAGMNRDAEEHDDDEDDDDDEDGEEMEEPSTSQDMPPPASPAEDDEPAPSTSSAPIVMMPFPKACGGRPLKSLKKAAKAKAAAPKPEKPPNPPKPVTNRSKFKNVDRKNATSMNITVDNVTIMITEYKLKTKRDKKESNSSNSSLVGESLNHMNEDSMDKPSTSSKAGSGAESESDSVRMGGGGPARGSSEELETTRSS